MEFSSAHSFLMVSQKVGYLRGKCKRGRGNSVCIVVFGTKPRKLVAVMCCLNIKQTTDEF